MKKITVTIFLAIMAIAALVWACSYKISGLAWFPGFVVALFCGIAIFDIWKAESDQHNQTLNRG